MKNILNEKPVLELNARLRQSIYFVKDSDIKNKKVLDIGCGFGWFELNALNRGVKEIFGIEITEKDLTAAKTIKDNRAIFKIGGALKLPFKDNYFDTVVAWEVIEHIPNNSENKMFREVNRVLKKDGKYYLSTPYDSILSKYLDPAWWLIGHRHYTSEKLTNLGKKSNFQVEEVFVKGGLWTLISLLNLYISKWLFRRGPFFSRNLINKEILEYDSNKKGFMGIFIKYKKVNS